MKIKENLLSMGKVEYIITEWDEIKNELIPCMILYKEFVHFPTAVKEAINKAYVTALSEEVYTVLDDQDQVALTIYLKSPKLLAQLRDELGAFWWKLNLKFWR